MDKFVREVKQLEEWEACEGLEISMEEYENAKQRIVLWEEDNTKLKSLSLNSIKVEDYETGQCTD